MGFPDGASIGDVAGIAPLCQPSNSCTEDSRAKSPEGKMP
jgi:hypothetical protein